MYGQDYRIKRVGVGQPADVPWEGRVLLGLMPKVTRRVKMSLTGEMGEWRTEYDGAALPTADEGA
jgi:hypothetical protein